MKSCTTLPGGYTPIYRIDLQKDKKLALLVNGAAILIILAMLFAASRIVPLETMWSSGDLSTLSLKLFALAAGLIAYIVLHEVVHAVMMRRFCTAKVHFGLTGLYAYAGSNGYYCKQHYIIIALAPVVFWGVVLTAACVLVPRSWFYIVYFIQMCNISGAVGDYYVAWKIPRLGRDVLVQDTGTAMTVFGRCAEEEIHGTEI